MDKSFEQSVISRRSRYAIDNQVKISDAEIEAVVRLAVKHAPSAFNSQSGRAILLLGNEHHALWHMIMEELRKIVPEDKFSATEEKIKSFDAGYGSVLFFEDQEPVQSLQERFPLYSEHFPNWSQQSSGMLQYIVWTGFAAHGLGASLQHYNEVIEKEVKAKWDIPESWKLMAQMPFGHAFEAPSEKTFLPLEDRLKVLKS